MFVFDGYDDFPLGLMSFMPFQSQKCCGMHRDFHAICTATEMTCTLCLADTAVLLAILTRIKTLIFLMGHEQGLSDSVTGIMAE